MADVSKEIENVTVDKEFRVCPACGYELGFHVSFVPEELSKGPLRLILICPSCGARYDVNKTI